MSNPNLGLLDIGGMQCNGIVSPSSVLDPPILGATTSYRISTTLLTTTLSSASMPVMRYALLQAICVAIGAKTTWITRGGGLRASCTGTSFQVLKLLDFTSFEDTELIPGDKAKETLLRLATTPPPPTARICFLMEYEGFLIVGARVTDGFMLMHKDPPGLQVVVHSVPSFPLLRNSSTLCYFLVVWRGLPLHPMKPKRAEFGELQLGPKFCQA